MLCWFPFVDGNEYKFSILLDVVEYISEAD